MMYELIAPIKNADSLSKSAYDAEMRWSRDSERARAAEEKQRDAENRFWTEFLIELREDVEGENRKLAERKIKALQDYGKAVSAAEAVKAKAEKAGVKDAADTLSKLDKEINSLGGGKDLSGALSAPHEKIWDLARDPSVPLAQAWDPFRVTQKFQPPSGQPQYAKFIEQDKGAPIVLDQFITTHLGLPDGLGSDKEVIVQMMRDKFDDTQATRMELLLDGAAGRDKWLTDQNRIVELSREKADLDQKMKEAGLTPEETKTLTGLAVSRAAYDAAIKEQPFDVMAETIRRKNELAGLLDEGGLDNPFSPSETASRAAAGTLPPGSLTAGARTALDQVVDKQRALVTDVGFQRWSKERGISFEGDVVPYSIMMRYANEAAGRGRLGWREAKGRRAQLRGTGAVYTVEAKDTETYDIGLRDPSGLPLFAFNEAGEFVRPERIAEQIDAQLSGSNVVVADLDDASDRSRIEGLLAAEGDTGGLVGAIQVAYAGDKPGGAQLFYDKQSGEVALVDGRGKVLQKHTLDKANATLLRDSSVDAKQNLFQPAGTADAVQSGGKGGNNLADLSGFEEGQAAEFGEYYPPGLGLTTTVPVKIFTSERTQYRAGMDPDVMVFMDVDPVTGEKRRREVRISDTLSVQRLSPEDQLTSFIEAGMRPGQARRRVRRNERKRQKYARREGTLAEGIVRARSPGDAEMTTFKRDAPAPVAEPVVEAPVVEAPVVEVPSVEPEKKPAKPKKRKSKPPGTAAKPRAGIIEEPIVATNFGSPVGAGESTGTPESEAQRRARTIMATGQVMTGEEPGGSGDTDLSAEALRRRKKARDDARELEKEYGARYTGTKKPGRK